MFALKRVAAAGALVVSALAACSDSTSPATVSAATLSTGVSGLSSAFINNAAFQSMASLVDLFPHYAAISLLRESIRSAAPSIAPSALSRRAPGLHALSLSLRSHPDALFPANVLGRTFVWDPVGGVYTVDSTITGAPAAGIRLVIYAINTNTGQPLVPLQQLGYVQLTDLSTPQANKLGVLLTLGVTTSADYAITAVTGTNSLTLSAHGLLQNPTGTGHVDFDFGNDIRVATIGYSSSLTGSDGTQIQTTVLFDSTTATLTVSITKDKNTIELDAGGAATLSGSVKYNGTTVATVSGDGNPPIFTATNGHVLSAAETTALVSIFANAVTIGIDLADVVFRPGDVVFH